MPCLEVREPSSRLEAGLSGHAAPKHACVMHNFGLNIYPRKLPTKPLEALGLAPGAGCFSGRTLHASIATLELLQRFAFIHLPASLAFVAHPTVLGIAAAVGGRFFADNVFISTRFETPLSCPRAAAAIIAYVTAGISMHP